MVQKDFRRRAEGRAGDRKVSKKIEAGTKSLSQTKEGLEFELFLKFQSFYFA